MSQIQFLATAGQAAAFVRQHCHGQLRTDSRQVGAGDVFIAWPGAATDGRAHVGDALARGAAACLVEAEGVQHFSFSSGAIAALPGLKAATGLIAADWHGNPSARLRVLAVTGTNGKTSTAWWLAHALNALVAQGQIAGTGCGLVGTLGVGVPPRVQSTGMTTPDPVRLQQAFADFAHGGAGECAIEASSIGLAEQRLAGTHIHTALFTNFTQDHLDWHADMQDYWRAKRVLFDWPGLAAAVVNLDDARGRELHAELQTRDLDLWGVAIERPARLRAQDVAHTETGLAFTVVEDGQRVALQTRLIGQFNISNLLGVIAGLRTLGVPLAQAVHACAQLAPVPGRMQQIALPGQPLVAVDYAHTPDALIQALAALKPVAAARGGRLHCVFGCGGDRDATKRPLMGAAAQHGADRVWVTSDNPRSEEPQAIVHQILQGMIASSHVRADPDRATAIALAIAEAAPEDVVLIAGKGHEDYQEVRGERRPFSDMEQAQAALARREGGA
ncbi:UDP-N-acetylmuramoyl-L-alanyl-D-glutamate--2,6-diaminopimelate ligase [Comamonas faecalis]|uniref:UDP-N-acetylmuramoyl-L-alanyl-D-glutamate--2,6-diaminopimelate ligase n=1 Tax=Comamonas faecalis TaxID=1387849 RepID=A0ABP7QJY7_9BURK